VLLRLVLDEFVIVESAEIEFAPGLNVLTGETGAGKSILVDAIGLLAGARGSAEWIRRGAERMIVEGAFDLAHAPAAQQAAESAGIPLEDGVLLVRREIAADGRSRCFAGGRQVLVSQLRELTAGALWSVGQGEQRALADPAEQEEVLDRFGAALELRARYRVARAAFLAAGETCARLQGVRESFAGEADFLRAQVSEIREADPAPGERARLQSAVARVRAHTEEAALSDELEARLFREEGSVLDHLETLVHRLGAADEMAWGPLRAKLESLRDAVRSLQLPAADEEEEGDLDAMEERLRLLARVCRRYGGDAEPAAEEAVLGRLAELEERLAEGESLEERLAAAEVAREAAREALGTAGGELSRRRAAAAMALAEAAGAELTGLGMPGAALRFAFRAEPDPDGVPATQATASARSVAQPPEPGALRVRPLENGLERVRLMFQSHPAEAEGELSRIASGGELSRVLLALHAALGEASPPGCWILDEIDAGIGGETARRVAARLARMARRAQVLLVTHLPAIAARAERHLCVVKEERGGRPVASVEPLAGEARVRELARMLAGEPDSPVARRHAKELLAARSAEDE
jgi:DNA repair protein RecN (Recombination protein N)